MNFTKSDKNKGQAVFTSVVFLMFISLTIVLTFGASIMANISLVKNLLESKKSFFLAESGAEDLAYRTLNGRNYSSQETLIVDGHYATTTIVSVDSDQEIMSIADVLENIRKVKINLTAGSSASFNYGVQVGDGGLVMENNSSVSGNVYSNGRIQGSNSNLVKGDVVSAGPSGSIDGIYATSSAYSNTIIDSTIDKNAYYQTISGSTVGGVLYPGSPDQSAREFPISDDLISQWKQSAESVQIINSPCPYVVNSDTTLGPTKINCSLDIRGDPTVTIGGPVWVNGNITIQNTAIIQLDPSLTNRSVAIIADNPSNRTSSSKIDLKNSATFFGADGNSFVLFISQNNSAESGGNEKAITIQNSANGDVMLFSGHGEILLQNSVSLKEVTGYRIRLQNTAEVIYESGLASLLFESGPSGGFSINSWREIK